MGQKNKTNAIFELKLTGITHQLQKNQIALNLRVHPNQYLNKSYEHPMATNLGEHIAK